jgi:hypothetical protein
MRKSILIASFTLAITLVLGGGMARAENSCADTEKWCEHKVATFCENGACSNIRTEGDCVPKEKSCEEYWCGNRQCQSSWLMSKDVCCVYYPEGSSPDYACATSEVSCRGNTARLTARPGATTTLAQAESDN